MIKKRSAEEPKEDKVYNAYNILASEEESEDAGKEEVDEDQHEDQHEDTDEEEEISEILVHNLKDPVIQPNPKKTTKENKPSTKEDDNTDDTDETDSNGSIIQFLQNKGIPVIKKDRRKKQEIKLINLIDFEITPLTEAEGNNDHHEQNTQTRSSTPREGEENTGRKIIEIHDNTSKLIVGAITQEPLPRPCPVQKEMATYWKTYQQPSNKTASSCSVSGRF